MDAKLMAQDPSIVVNMTKKEAERLHSVTTKVLSKLLDNDDYHLVSRLQIELANILSWS